MRLLTRSDFDGLGCAALLKELGMLDEIKFVHPKDVQDGQFEATSNDILANVPYVPGCGLWFDHHSSEVERNAAGQFEGFVRHLEETMGVIGFTDERSSDKLVRRLRRLFLRAEMDPDEMNILRGIFKASQEHRVRTPRKPGND